MSDKMMIALEASWEISPELMDRKLREAEEREQGNFTTERQEKKDHERNKGY